jgi:signal transduction histidine kinase
MTPPPDCAVDLELARRLSETLFSLVESPAALVARDGLIVASNAAWVDLVGSQSTILGECLRGFSGVESLVSGAGAGVVTLLGSQEPSMRRQSPCRDYVARWREVEVSGRLPKFSMVVLSAPEADARSTVSIINAQRVSINNLLIRQTLIEEKERRRLGFALHDGISQELVLIRSQIIHPNRPDDMTTRLVGALDAVIESIRDLTFDLCPLILEDLGIRPAMHWLADYLGQRYGTHITVVDDARDPRLSHATRTIVFRAVRELAINAAKHAKEAEIIISCITGPRTARFSVRDTGPGFDPSALTPATDCFGRFGLFSVEQQIRGIGGAFELVSHVGEGTRAIITAPLEPEEDAAHE